MKFGLNLWSGSGPRLSEADIFSCSLAIGPLVTGHPFDICLTLLMTIVSTQVRRSVICEVGGVGEALVSLVVS